MTHLDNGIRKDLSSYGFSTEELKRIGRSVGAISEVTSASVQGTTLIVDLKLGNLSGQPRDSVIKSVGETIDKIVQHKALGVAARLAAREDERRLAEAMAVHASD